MPHHNRHFSGDPHAASGFWGPPSSAANFCEEDYAVTIYIAEFINCLTSLSYVYFAFRAPGLQPRGSSLVKLDPMAVSLIFVGVTSLIFHAILRQDAQFSDDLSMIFLAGSLIQPLYTHNESARIRYCVNVLLCAGFTAFSTIYIRSGNILIHFLTFSALLTLVWPRTLFLIYGRPRSSQEKSLLIKKFLWAVTVFVTAFIIWNIDLETCLELRSVRNKLGLPWAWLLECHGWWHILTALGAHKYMQLIREMCYVSYADKRL